MKCHTSEIAAEFVILHCRLQHGKKFFSAKTKTSPPLKLIQSQSEFFEHYNLKGVREDSRMGMLGWLRGDYPLELRLEIPSPMEMLTLQCEGRRVATLLLGEDQQLTPIGRHAGAYEFLLHDLEHAHKFFGGEFRGQMHFFRLLHQAITAGSFSSFSDDPRFLGELDYLMSDMNSHPVHLLKYLKAIVLSTLQRRNQTGEALNHWSNGLFDLWKLPGEAKTAAMRVNFPEIETRGDLEQVSRFFDGPT